MFGLSASASKSTSKTTNSNKYLESIYNKLTPGLQTEAYDNPYLNSAQQQYQKVLSDGYQAYSNQDMQRMYNNQAQQLGESFKQQENNLAGRLARSGLSGSRIGAKALANQANGNNKILADVSNNIQNQNLQATLQNQQQAMGLASGLSASYINNQQAYLNPWLQFGNMMSGLGTSTTKGKTTSIGASYGMQ